MKNKKPRCCRGTARRILSVVTTKVTFKLTQGHRHSCHLIGHNLHDFLLVFYCNYVSILHRFEIFSLISQNFITSRDHGHAHPGIGCHIVTTNLIRTTRTRVQNLKTVASFLPDRWLRAPKFTSSADAEGQRDASQIAYEISHSNRLAIGNDLQGHSRSLQLLLIR